jgi:hypothetical protein
MTILPPEKHERDFYFLLLQVINQARTDFYSLIPVRYRMKRATGLHLWLAQRVFASTDYTFKYFLDDEEKPINIVQALKSSLHTNKVDLKKLQDYLENEAKAVVDQEVKDMLKVPEVFVYKTTAWRVIFNCKTPSNDKENAVMRLRGDSKDVEGFYTALGRLYLDELSSIPGMNTVSENEAAASTLGKSIAEFLAVNGNIFFDRNVYKCRVSPVEDDLALEEDV